MQITHQEAHRLIQFRADGGLKAQQRNLLASHLQECANCQHYADSLESMETMLRPMLQRNWKRDPLPFPVALLTAKREQRISDRIVAVTRIAAFAVVFLGFFFSAWNFSVSSRHTPTPFLQGIPVIPTPFTSASMAATETDLGNCTMTSYVVEKHDTLAGIAHRFSASTEQILQINSIKNETVVVGQSLNIPVCPSPAANPTASQTITFTPVLSSVTTTPGG